MLRSGKEKRRVQLAFEETLNIFDALGREPDAWEEGCLVDALCSMAAQQYSRAGAQLIKVAIAVKSNRQPVLHAERPRRVTKEKMRLGLTHIRIHR